MAKKGSKLSLKETRFVDEFLGGANGNATEAAVRAGYTGNRNSARVIGTRLLAKAAIGEAIAARVKQQQKATIAEADERDEILTKIARKENEDALTRISAVKELNKCSGRHSIKHLHSGKLTLEEVLGDVNADR